MTRLNVNTVLGIPVMHIPLFGGSAHRAAGSVGSDEWQTSVHAHIFPRLVFVTLGMLVNLSQSQLLSYKTEIIIVLIEWGC